MARITKRLEAVEKAMGEKQAQQKSLVVPEELALIGLVSPATKKPVQYFDLRTGQFLPVDANPKQ